MGVLRMGYAHVRVTDLAEARDHYVRTLGMYVTAEEPGKLHLKCWDEWDHHSVVLEEGGVGVVKFGFKVEYESDIDLIEKTLVCGDSEVIVKNHLVGICGTDKAFYRGQMPEKTAEFSVA